MTGTETTRFVAYLKTLCTLGFLFGVLPVTAFFGCGGEPEEQPKGKEVAQLDVWAHSGREGERKTIQKQVQQFDNEHDKIGIELTILPEGSYNTQVQSAALAGDLPDVLEFDGPFVYNYVWQGHLISIDDYLSQETRENLISSILEQGTYRGALYTVGMYDSGLAMYGRKGILENATIRIPTSPDEAWTADEFKQILGMLAKDDPDGSVLDLKLNYRGEWFTYAFSPVIQSAGGDLIDRSDFQSAEGVLNGTAAVYAMSEIQSWIESGYVDPNIDDNAFIGGRVALSWVGHWEYNRYSDAFGDDLVLIPLPDFGEGSQTGQGSWNWGITKKCGNPEAAMSFIEFLLEDSQILAMTQVNAAVPGTSSAISKSELYKDQSPLRLFVTQLVEDYAVPRPRTPAYPVITSVFQQAFDDIRNGADVQETLDKAVTDIDQDIRDNRGYPPVE